MTADVSRPTNYPQLQWKRLGDLRKVSECGRYLVSRRPDYSAHPAMTYEYIAERQRMSDTEKHLGTFETFDLAAEACERDLADQPQPKGN